MMRKAVSLLALATLALGCGQSVTPSVDVVTLSDVAVSESDAGDSLFRESPSCPLPLARCAQHGDPCVCGQCRGVVNTGATQRYCMPDLGVLHSPFSAGCFGRYRNVCSGRGVACLNTPNEMFGGNCLDLPTCLWLRDQVVAWRGMSGVDRCLYSDGTEVVQAAIARAECTINGMTRCGYGCDACPSGQSCMFVSERSPTGICLTNAGANGVAGCNGAAPRTLCPNGSGCVVPLAESGNEDRVGACAPYAQCDQAQRNDPARYRCLGDLHE
ncbi:MAG: hypothetical protein Q8Q09_09695 [Deltaproteobacteria bacterium]|nr:hypothetical protein [Deltaproteobacteria bacterium]